MTKITLTTNQQLFNVAKKHNVNDSQLSNLLGKSRHTIAKWRLPETAKGRRSVGVDTLLCLKLAILAHQTISPETLKLSGVLDTSIFAK